MNLKNFNRYCEITSENRLEASAIFTIGLSLYCPRAAGLTMSHDYRISLTQGEAHDFSANTLRDERINASDRWAICHLIARWLSGEITDEATASK